MNRIFVKFLFVSNLFNCFLMIFNVGYVIGEIVVIFV